MSEESSGSSTESGNADYSASAAESGINVTGNHSGSALEFSNLESMLGQLGISLNNPAIESAINNGESLEYILVGISDGTLINGYAKRDGDYSNMAVYADTEKAPTSDEYRSIAERIAQKRQSGKIPDSTIANNPEIIEYNMEAWLSALRDFKSDPAKYAALSDYVSSIGRDIKEPKKAGIFDHQPNAVARTYAGETIEANIEMWNMLDRLSGESGIPSSYLLEMAIAHEYFHSSQPNSILYGNPFPYVAEMDVEFNMANFFLNKSKSSAEAYDKNNYENVAKHCLERYTAIAYAMNNNIPIGVVKK